MLRMPVSVLLGLASASWLGLAQATPEYPSVIDATLGVSCGQPASRCLICHTTARGGQGTAEQAFVRYLGATFNFNRGHDANALRSALTRLDATHDSDGDGEPDKQELLECGNPSGDDLGGGPTYGCDGAQLAPPPAPGAGRSPALSALALSVAALLAYFGRRR